MDKVGRILPTPHEAPRPELSLYRIHHRFPKLQSGTAAAHVNTEQCFDFSFVIL
jgi:hypothetical protein